MDDKKENLVALQQVLSDVDAEIIEATSGNQALTTTLVHDFSLAILDVQMPAMDGYELAELLRGDPKTANLPVIFMTAAYGEEIDVFKGYEAGAVDYIVKPYKPAVLLAKVRVFLDLQRAQKELARRVLELSASEERYRTLVMTIPDIVYRIDTEGRFTFLNDAVRSLGYSPEELIGLSFAEIVIPADVENVSRRFVLPRFAGKRTGDEGAPKLFDERRTGSRQTLTMEVRLVSRRAERAVPAELHSGGRPVLTAEVNSSGLYGSIEGRPSTFLGTVGIIRDITERKEAEDELSRYRQGLEKMVEDQTVELKERVKEVNCLYAVSDLFAKPSKSIDEALKSAADLIPTGWQHPEVARARIVFEGREFASEGFRKTPWKQSADIVLSGETVGTVEVCYLEERPALDEGPFLKEERGLIDELARQLAVMILRERAQAHLGHINGVLRSIRDVNQLIVTEKQRGPFIQMVCKNLTHTRSSLQGAWIILTDGLPDRVEGAQSGFNDIAFSELLNLFQRGETPACFRHGQTESGVNVTNDPAAACKNCPLADTYGRSGAITIELKHDNRRYGCMGIAVPIEFANDKEEASLFEEIAGDIAYALASIEQEEALRKSQQLLESRARIAGAFLTASDDDVFGVVLDIVLSIMQSEFGVFGYIDEHGNLVIPSMTRHIWDKCRVPEKDIRYPHDTWGDSLWCRALREKRTFHSNQPSAKVPAGHIPIQRNVAVPIVFQGEVIGLLQVANKETDYDADDIHLQETICDAIAPILNTRLQRDQQERKRAEADGAVKEAEARYRAIFEGAAEGILVADLETQRFRYCNPAICKMLGYTEEEFIGLGVTDIHPKESLDHVLAAFEAQARGDRLLASSLPCLRKDGSVIYADVTAAPVVIDGRKCNVGFFVDVTEHRKLEAQLMQSQKMEAVGRLAGGIAHDFNNLLTSIIGYGELSLMSAGEDELLRENIEEIVKAGKSAAALTRQLLAFSRKQTIKPEVLNLNDIITDHNNMMKRLIGEELEIEIVLSPDLFNVKVDPSQVEQVLMNLLVNAKDAMSIGGKVTIETANMELDESYVLTHGIEIKAGSYVLLKISDTGIGMDKETQANIFEPFFTTKEKGKGTGLGLSTVYGIIKQNNGYIWVYSEPGEGTTFKIYLPISEDTVKPFEKKEYKPDELNGNETILLVEDEESVRKMVKKALESFGYSVLVAQEGDEAISLFKLYQDQIQLVITDVVMPIMSGPELIVVLQSLKADIKTIYMSGYSNNAILHQRVLEDGINFIEKPFSPQEIALKVRQVLDTD
ncbi:PAS domain S-box protein [Thermodesulfobacteriota bacterium]